MSRHKRSRPHEDVDCDAIESASSMLQSRPPKRNRVVLAAERGRSAVSDDDSAIEEYANLVHEPPDLEPLWSSDNEVEEDEIDEIRASEYMQRHTEVENAPSDQGIIEEVFCRNFMCHSKLRVRLGPLINFIIGHNGSGKSAVLTALTMCLGGKATATNRGASLKSLIKEGEESATLAVRIKNQGENAYKPELYGTSIVVERHFSRSGTSGFKLKNSEDKTVSTKKSDLDDILDFFAFQLDNPINVLTQDMARQFLSNSSTADKYKFFIRGTQLETLNNDYELVEEHHDNMAIKLDLREGDLKNLRQKYDDAEARKKRLNATRTIRDKIRALERMHAWAQVGEQEVILEDREEALRRAAQHVDEKEAAAEAASGAFEGHDQSYLAAQRNLSDLQAPLSGLEDVFNQAKETFDGNKAELQKIMAEQRKIKNNFQEFSKDKKNRENEIAEEQKRLADAEGPTHVQRLNKLQQLQQEAARSQQALSDHEKLQTDLDDAYRDAKEAFEASRPIISRTKDDVQSAQARLNGLAMNQGREFAAYHPKMENLFQAIQNETRWRSTPIGPIGRHVKLMKPEWSSVLETTFGSVLNSFAVSTTDDLRLLNQLIKKLDVHTSVFQGSATSMDTTPHEPDGDVDTILRVLRIDNDLVRNTLVINNFIDQTVLIKDQEQAAEFMYDSGRRPNVRATIAMAASPGTGTRYEWTRYGQKSSPVRAWKGSTRMQTDREQQIRIQKERLNHAQDAVKEAEQQQQICNDQLQRAVEARAQWKKEKQELKRKADRAQETVEVQDEEIENNRPRDGRLQELQKQLAEACEERDSADASYQDSVNEKDRLDEIARQLKSDLDDAQGSLDEQKSIIEAATKRLEKLTSDRAQALFEKNEAYEEIGSARARAEDDRVARDEQQTRIEEYTAQASQISPRVPVEENVTPEILDRRVELLCKDLERLESEAGGTREELTRAWFEARKELKEASIGYQDMKSLMNKIKVSLNERQRRWGLFRKYISARSRIMFKYMLSERGFRGRMLVDHSSRLLDIKVEPNINVSSDSGRQAKTLSGGEKSFSTICLLLSIWEAIGSPIRCLDEFDVFMDSVNRATSMNMMIQAARRATGRQFILITPQAMNNVEMGNDVRVHRMSDPERGQTTLPF